MYLSQMLMAPNAPTTSTSDFRLPTIEEVRTLRAQFPDLVRRTPLSLHAALSEEFGRPVYLKDERKQPVRSYKNRGALAKLLSLTPEERERGVVCASAGNHAQGVAAGCYTLGIKGTIFMPTITPQQKIDATNRHGNGMVEIILTGDKFDRTAQEAQQYAHEYNSVFIHPFDDLDVIRGQSTVGLEIAEQIQHIKDKVGEVLVPVGGGGLLAGTTISLPDKQLVGVEPAEAASMSASLGAGRPVTLEDIDTFVDGAAVARPGDNTFKIVSQACSEGRVKIETVSKGLLCSTMDTLLQRHGEVTEPAGALSIAALHNETRKTKNAVVCVVSGNNLDMRKVPSILEHASLHRREKAYVNVSLPDRPGALVEMLETVKGDIVDSSINISFLHYDEDGDNGDPPLQMGIRSRTGEPARLLRFLRDLRNVKDEDGKPKYPVEELPNKPE